MLSLFYAMGGYIHLFDGCFYLIQVYVNNSHDTGFFYFRRTTKIYIVVRLDKCYNYYKKYFWSRKR